MKVHKLWAAVGTALAVLAPAIAVVAAQPAQAQTYSVLYSLRSKHGMRPYGGVVRDAKGNLYGTTVQGGAYRFGVVFKLTASGKEKVLHSFTLGADGGSPFAGLVLDKAGNLYGTTGGGEVIPLVTPGWGCGVVFKLDKTGTETVLYTFTGGADGAGPSGLVLDKAGNLYGAAGGGAYGAGVAFKLDTTGAYTVLYSFTGGADGAGPSGLMLDKAGNLYGTTSGGGTYGAGVVFKLDATGAETVLYSFTGGADGAGPVAGVVRDPAGNLYGTTSGGGAKNMGAVFKLDKTGAETVLHSFTGRPDGRYPVAGLVRDSAGNLYGTTMLGGDYPVKFHSGTIFKVDVTGVETVLHIFRWSDGRFPVAGLVRDSAGNLYGTTTQGGAYTTGVVFKITPQ